jgi:hypothetical protein
MKELKGLVLDLPRHRSVMNDPEVRRVRITAFCILSSAAKKINALLP